MLEASHHMLSWFFLIQPSFAVITCFICMASFLIESQMCTHVSSITSGIVLEICIFMLMMSHEVSQSLL